MALVSCCGKQMVVIFKKYKKNKNYLYICVFRDLVMPVFNFNRKFEQARDERQDGRVTQDLSSRSRCYRSSAK